MSDIHTLVAEIEAVLKARIDNGLNKQEARKKVLSALQSVASLPSDLRLTLATTIQRGVASCPGNRRRPLAVMLIRLVGASDLLTNDDKRECRKEMVSVVEDACPDLTKSLFNRNAMNHEKIEAIARIHQSACGSLEPLVQPFASLPDLAERRQNMMRSLNGRKYKGYLGTFGYNTVLEAIRSLLSQVDTVFQSRGHERQTTIQQILEDIPIQIENCEQIQTFVATDFAIPFLKRLHSSALTMKDRMAADFACHIRLSETGEKGEKGYPLHRVGSTIEVSVPMINSGPGVAQNVTSYCVADNCKVINAETRLGNVKPGPYVLPLVIELTQATTKLTPMLEVKWSVVGDPNPHAATFTTLIRGQRTDIDWEPLELHQPYSLEVAYKDDFYGRRDVLSRIIRRLTSNPMHSCYVTGQKRVGKSSLARAVQSMIEQTQDTAHYHVLYLECGAIMFSTGEQTMAEFGRQLEEHFSCHLGPQAAWEPRDYSSSLSPLNKLLEALRREDDSNRFVVIMDEFDEINESLYSHGELANTFFLNVRTLASKRNLAFVLVGAEKMPYLMASQGEKLNKFARELLDSFDQKTEWSDFSSLVRDPVAGSIVFHESALRRLYDLTDGHPFFTKALCAEAYELALRATDAEISDMNIERAAQRLLMSLDTNAFAHYWRDGTRGDADEVEIAAVKRCRTLVSWARTVRSGAAPTVAEIERHLYGPLQRDEMRHQLDDFCRRTVFEEEDRQYSPRVVLFGRWLRDGGFAQLVDGHIGDELEENRQREEDKAYVKSDEVVELANRWSLYQGNALTEDRIRAWIDQADSNVARRQLFKLLKNMRFVTEIRVQEAFQNAYDTIRRRLPVFVQRKRSQRRHDVLVTFFGSAAKSGAQYASQFAKANLIVQQNVVAPERLATGFRKNKDVGISAVIVIDDMIGTGSTLAGDLESHCRVLQELEIGSTVPLFLCVLCGTVQGEAKVRRYLEGNFDDSDLYVCETLEEHHFAFGEELGFWDSDLEKQQAKSMVMDLGARVDKRRPLGYRGQGLLLTFYRNCPNNSLPILFGSGRGEPRWTPLFPRLQV